MNVRLKRAALFFFMLLIVISISSCTSNSVNLPKNSAGVTQVEWIQINPPPGVNGPCYAFFHSEGFGNFQWSYAGVYCKP